jgi:hypothetical protein
MALTKVLDAGLNTPASDLQDNEKIILGAGDDMQLYHDGNHNIIKGAQSILLKKDDSESYVRCIADGAVSLHHNNLKVLETITDGVRVTAASNDAELQIRSRNQDGATLIRFASDDGDDNNDWWRIRADGGGDALGIQNYADGAWEANVVCRESGGVELYHDNSKKFETTADGVQVTGKIFSSSHLDFADDVKLLLGTGDDLQIWHDGTHSYIQDEGTGALRIRSDSEVAIQSYVSSTNKNMAKFVPDGAVELYHNNVKCLETVDAGIKITGQSKGVCTQNLIHNGAMVLSQRGHFQSNLSGAANGFHIDRWKMVCQGVNENPTMLKHDLTNAEAPWDEGFRYSLLLRNGNQTGGGGAGDFMFVRQIIEARNMRHSGWSFKDSTSFITLSFWVKSSVAQNFYGFCKTNDGTAKIFPWETGSLTANTWTKVTVTMPGNSDISFDENNGAGMEIAFAQFWGTNYTHPSEPTYNQWSTWDSAKRALNYGTAMDDWYETNDAEFELTGVQLEVGKVANDYKFQSLHEVMLECKRYYHLLPGSNATFANCFNGCYNSDTELVASYWFPNEMRGSPSFEYGSALSDFDWEPHDEQPNNLSLRASNTRMASIQSTGHTDNNRQGHAAVLTIDNPDGYVAFYNDY